MAPLPARPDPDQPLAAASVVAEHPRLTGAAAVLSSEATIAMHPVTQTLLHVLDNQIRRTDVALEGLPEELFDLKPGGDCNSIRGILIHMMIVRRFMLTLMESPLADELPIPSDDEAASLSPDAVIGRLAESAQLCRTAFESFDGEAWLPVPDPPLDGRWGDLPMAARVVRPLNDVTNHIGGIRMIRRMHDHGVDQTQ